MFYTLQKKGWIDARFIQTWDGTVVAASAGFDLFLGEPVRKVLDWANKNGAFYTCKQETTSMHPATDYPLVIHRNPEKNRYEAYCPKLPEVTGAGRTPQNACDAGWIGVARALADRQTTGTPVPTPDECRAALKAGEAA